MKPVLFAATKPLARAENLRTVYEAYEGEKAFVQVDPWRRHPEIRSGKYGLMVIDEYPTETPGKAILLWHAINGGKTVGLDQPHPYHSRMNAGLITCAVTAGKGTVGMTARGAGIPDGRVLPLGMPRTDGYAERKKGDGGTVMAGKRGYLYAPTFRSGGEPDLPDLDWAWLDGELTDGEILVVKAHTMTGKGLLKGTYRHIVEADAYEPTAPYLYDCDAVVTDYSSVIFDGYLLGKPAVLLEKNPGYVRARGMYLPYPKAYTDRYCRSEQEMLALLRTADGLSETERACAKHVAGACDGHATERMCALIRQMAE